jgi:hypothetical protein
MGAIDASRSYYRLQPMCRGWAIKAAGATL